MCYFAENSRSRFPENRKMDKYLWRYVLFFTSISAIRWGVGADSISYAEYFTNGITANGELISEMDKEVIMFQFFHLIHDMNLHFSIGLGCLAFLQIFFLTFSLKEYKPILLCLPILMFGSCYFLDLMNGVRQMTVACIFVYSSRFIVQKKPFHYFIFVLIAYYCHNSALILAPFYFIPSFINVANHRTLMMVVYTLCFVFGLTPQFQGIIQFVKVIAVFIGYESYTDRVEEYLSGSYSAEIHALGPMQLSYLMIGYFVIWFGPYLKRKYEKKIPYFNLWYFFAFFYGCAFFLVTNTSHIFIRPVQYFELFQMIIASLLLYELFCKENRLLFSYVVKYGFLFVIWINIIWNVVKADTQTNPEEKEYVTYKTFFMHLDEVQMINKQ